MSLQILAKTSAAVSSVVIFSPTGEKSFSLAKAILSCGKPLNPSFFENLVTVATLQSHNFAKSPINMEGTLLSLFSNTSAIFFLLCRERRIRFLFLTMFCSSGDLRFCNFIKDKFCAVNPIL